jgi:hypothetical protein
MRGPQGGFGKGRGAASGRREVRVRPPRTRGEKMIVRHVHDPHPQKEWQPVPGGEPPLGAPRSAFRYASILFQELLEGESKKDGSTSTPAPMGSPGTDIGPPAVKPPGRVAQDSTGRRALLLPQPLSNALQRVPWRLGGRARHLGPPSEGRRSKPNPRTGSTRYQVNALLSSG